MSAGVRLRVVTFNIHGGRPRQGPPDLPAIARVLAGLEPDLVGLQEVHQYLPPPGVFEDQPRRLGALLDLHVTFRRSFGAGRCGYGNAILARGAPTAARRVLLPGTGERRSLLETRVHVGGRSLRFLNTHLGLSAEDRRLQAEAIARRVRAEEGPLILVGDLNADPESPEVRLLEEEGLLHCVPPHVLTYPDDTPAWRIDMIMASAHFRSASGGAVPTNASDHLPLVADLVLDPDW